MVRSLRVSLISVFFLLIFAIAGQCLADESAAYLLYETGYPVGCQKSSECIF